MNYSFAHDVILSHWAPSWLILQITLAVYRETVVSIYYFIVSLRVLWILIFKICGSIGSQTKNRCFLFAMCSENQPRWRRLQTIHTQAKIRQNPHSLFCCMLFVYCYFGKETSTIYLLKTTKNWNNSAREMFRKIIHRSERFWQEIVFVLIYFLYTNTIHKSSLRRFDKSEFFPHKNKHFYIFYLQNFVNYFFSPSLMFIDIKSR